MSHGRVLEGEETAGEKEVFDPIGTICDGVVNVGLLMGDPTSEWIYEGKDRERGEYGTLVL